MKYNAFGQRSVETITGGGTHFLFSPDGLLLAEHTTTGALVRNYVYLNGQPIALVDNAGTVSYILTDQLGQPQKMLDASGAVTWQRVAGIFGDTVSQPVGSTAANPLRFPGQQFDPNTTLHYNYYRDYDPSTGRYLEADPIGLKGGINVYSYVQSDPINSGDPLGLKIVFEGNRDNYMAAISYLKRDPGMARIIRELEEAWQTYTIRCNSRQDDESEGNDIAWDPHAAIKTTEGGSISPALLLGHELAHADKSFWDGLVGWMEDDRYDYREERRVITGPERNAAKSLGESIRHDHQGELYYVPSPTSR